MLCFCMSGDAGHRGMLSVSMWFIISVVASLVFTLIVLHIYGGTLREKLDVFGRGLIDTGTDMSFEKKCVELDPGKHYYFSRGTPYDFNDVDLGDIEVKNIRHFGLLMKCQRDSNFIAAHIKEWRVSCSGEGTPFFDEKAEINVMCGFFKGAAIQFLDNAGHETEIECYHKVDVHIEIEDEFLAGMWAKPYLCYVADR